MINNKTAGRDDYKMEWQLLINMLHCSIKRVCIEGKVPAVENKYYSNNI